VLQLLRKIPRSSLEAVVEPVVERD